MHEATRAERRAARERVSAYYELELGKLIEHVENAIGRYRAGEIGVHDVDDVLHRYSKAARELWKFCWSRGSGSHVLFVARALEMWAAEPDEVEVGGSGEASSQAPLVANRLHANGLMSEQLKLYLILN